MANSNNIQVGPATVSVVSGTFGNQTYNGLDLGAFTTDGVTASIITDTVDIATDQTGTQPAKVFVGGQGGTVTTPMLEEAFDQLLVSIPGAVSGTNGVLFGGRSAGYDLLANWSTTLVVTPLDSDRPEYEFYKCVPTGQVDFTFNALGATILNVVWRVLPDTSRADGKRLFERRPQ